MFFYLPGEITDASRSYSKVLFLQALSHSLIYTIPGRAPRLANAQQKGENFLKLFEESSKWKHSAGTK